MQPLWGVPFWVVVIDVAANHAELFGVGSWEFAQQINPRWWWVPGKLLQHMLGAG
jgi:hypothetical protein